MEYDKNVNDLEKSILATIVYYDVLDRPLTSWEVFRYLVKIEQLELRHRPFERDLSLCEMSLLSMSSLNSVLILLDNSVELKKYISQENGFYFLKNRQGLVRERIKRQLIADKKWKKARRMIWFLQAIPYIRLVTVSGSLAMNNSKKESDIDLLIITHAGRIWTCRALTTLFLHLFGQRRHGLLTKDRFCLNHYLTDQS